MSMYNRQFSIGAPLTPAVKSILIINIVIFFIDALFRGVLATPTYFAISRQSILEQFKIYQFITYGFFHGGVLHIVFNMLGLWLIGGALEQAWGRRRFINFYLISILGGGVFALFSVHPAIGASGAIIALLVGYAMMWPDREVLLFFVLPVKAKFLVAFLVLTQMACWVSPPAGDNIAYNAHIGGMLFGFLYLYFIILRNKAHVPEGFQGKVQDYFKQRRLKKKQDVIDRRISINNTVDQLLAKISREGISSLSKEEKEFLKRASKELNKTDHETFN